MGMHFGIVAANTSWDRFLEVLRRHTGEFIHEGPVDDPMAASIEPRDDGFTVLGGELEGCSYLLDSSMLLSMSAQDLLAEMSKESGLLVAGCGAETVSGTFSFFAVRAGEPMRLYHHCHANLRMGLQAGPPLPTEATHPLEDLDGVGMTRALAHFGFDFDGWLARGTHEKYLYSARELENPAGGQGILRKGRVKELIDHHYGLHKLAPEDAPKLQVVVRDRATGQVKQMRELPVSLGSVTARKPSWFARLFGRSK